MDMGALLTLLGAIGFRLLESIITSYKRLGKFDVVDIIKEFLRLG